MAKKKKPVTPESEVDEECRVKALLFELDNVALAGRELVYDVLSGVLEEKGVKLSVGQFCQYCLYAPVQSFVPTLLANCGRTRLSEEKLIAEVNEAVKLMFVDGNIKLNDGMDAVIDAAIADGAFIGVLSAFDEKTTAKIMEKLGLDKRGAAKLHNGHESKNVPSTDAWLKLAKTMKVPPSCCVVIASSSRSCKAALSAGMRCAVLPDKFTSFQDFGGADRVLNALDQDAVASIISLLEM